MDKVWVGVERVIGTDHLSWPPPYLCRHSPGIGGLRSEIGGSHRWQPGLGPVPCRYVTNRRDPSLAIALQPIKQRSMK